MAEFSYPFDGGTGSILTEDDWSDMASLWQDDGVVASNPVNRSELRVEQPSGSPNIVTVSPGRAYIQGFLYKNTDDLELAFSTNESSHPRIDRIVLRLNRNTNTIQAVLVEGSPAATPVPPALNTTYPVYELSLATMMVAAGQSTGTVEQTRTAVSRYIRVSEDTTGANHPRGSIVYNPTQDALYKVGQFGELTPLGGSSGGGGSALFAYRNTDSAGVTGPGQIYDDVLTLTVPESAYYMISGVIYYRVSASNNNCDIGLDADDANTWRISYRYHPSSNNLADYTSNTIGTGPTVGAATTSFQFMTFTCVASLPAGVNLMIFTAAHTGGTWTIGSGSFIRAERMT